MAKVVRWIEDGQIWGWKHRCPGCNSEHVINVEIPTRVINGKRHSWKFNGDVDKPTFKPSVNIVGRCHYYITDGTIAYQDDCQHALKSQTVPLPDYV